MNLVLDIGNSSTKVALFENGQIIEQFVAETLTRELLDGLKQKYASLSYAILSSVARVDNSILSFLEQSFDFFIKLDHQTPIPLENCYRTPQTLGLDRLAAAVGANSLFPKTDLLIIDAGTAITYDLVDHHHRFLGGNISPGLKTRFRALHEFTHQLPLVESSDEWPLIGQTTEEAIRAGVLNGLVFEMDAMIDRMKKDYPKIITILTGGHSFFFDKKLKNAIFAQFEITLIGLNRILEYNYNAKKK